jgi:hypothetical protein
MSKLQWFRLYHRVIDDEKIRLLAFEDRWHFIALCCLKADGLLDEPDSPIKWRKIAVKMGVQTRELDEVRRRLQEVELIDENMMPLAWDALQYVSDTSTERVRKHREKSKSSVTKRGRNVSVTPPDTDTDTEATPNGVASAPLPAKSDLDSLTDKLLEAVGDKIQPHGAIVLAPILGLIEGGCDLETDILPSIRAQAARLARPAGKWAYFVPGIREAYETRIAAGKGLTQPKPSNIVPGSWEQHLPPEQQRAKWAKTLVMARGPGIWKSWLWGPPPGQPGCRIPSDLLDPQDTKIDWFEEKETRAA